eukprot:COSAG06_NODE_2071_length_7666_cov_12.184353_6_plen_192_part_00
MGGGGVCETGLDSFRRFHDGLRCRGQISSKCVTGCKTRRSHREKAAPRRALHMERLALLARHVTQVRALGDRGGLRSAAAAVAAAGEPRRTGRHPTDARFVGLCNNDAMQSHSQRSHIYSTIIVYSLQLATDTYLLLFATLNEFHRHHVARPLSYSELLRPTSSVCCSSFLRSSPPPSVQCTPVYLARHSE